MGSIGKVEINLEKLVRKQSLLPLVRLKLPLLLLRVITKTIVLHHLAMMMALPLLHQSKQKRHM